MKLQKKQRKNKEAFWITNISKKIVSLSDLGLVIHPMRSVDLLDDCHYQLTKDQLIKSAQSGSLFVKRDKLVIRKVPPPEADKEYIPIQEDAIFIKKNRSGIKIEDIKYEELNVSDDDYATENAELAEEDHLGKWKTNK